jgi:hypothetical protein
MPTEQLTRPSLGSGPARTDDFEPVEQPLAGNIGVIHGIYTHSVPLAGITVRRARAELSERLNIAPDALALVDGNEVGDDFILVAGQVLNFVKDAGEKGA